MIATEDAPTMTTSTFAVPEPVRDAVSRPLRKDVILCLDDDTTSRKLLHHLLKADFEVLTCDNFEIARYWARTGRINHFICDYFLGRDLIASTVLRRLLAEPNFRPDTCVLITVDPSPEVIRDAFEAGFVHHFSKPLRFDFREFYQGVAVA